MGKQGKKIKQEHGMKTFKIYNFCLEINCQKIFVFKVGLRCTTVGTFTF